MFVQHAPSQQDGFGQHSLPHIVPATGHPARAKRRYAILEKYLQVWNLWMVEGFC